MFFGGDDALGDLRPGVQIIWIQVAELEAGDEQAAE